MRRLFPLLLILPLAACSSPATKAGGETATPGTIPPPAATSVAPSAAPGAKGAGGDAALSKDTKAICGQADKLTAQFGATFTQDLKALVEAPDAAKAEVEQKTKRDVQNFSFALKDLSQLAGDAEVKKALAAMGKEVTALDGDVSKLDADKIGELSGKLDKACGRS